MALISLGSGVFYEATTVGSGTGNYDSFLRLGANDQESGYNTDASGQLDNKEGLFTHALKVSDLAVIVIGGVSYYEIRLDLNEVQSGTKPNITLDDLQIFRGAAAGAGAAPGFAGLTKVFDLAGTLSLIDTNHGSGTDDYRFLLPTSLFPNANEYFTLYAKFSGSDDGFEEFRAKTNTFVPNPDVGVLKVTNGVDDECRVVIAGQNVTWTYTVENNGNLPLSNVKVKDDAGTPGDTSDDFFATYVGGDVNNNQILDLDETWTFTASGTAQAGEYVNVATVSGDWTYGGVTSTVSAIEEDCYYGATPSIAVVKRTNGIDDDCSVILAGKAVTWTYEVSNTGDIALGNVVVTDDNGTAGDDTDDFTANAVLVDGFNIGDLNKDNMLDLNETWQFTYSGTAAPGEYHNVATVKGDATDGFQNVVTVDNTEDDCYYGATPSIALVKKTNGFDDSCPVILAGKAITWTYEVSNTGDIALGNIVVTDDNGTAGDTSDDFTANAVLSGGYNIGDVNQNNLLDLTETWQFTYAGTAKAGEYANVATVKGVATDDFQNTETVEATEDDCYYGATPSIAVIKKTNGFDDDCPAILAGKAVTWTYEVSNTGDIALGNVVVKDDNGTAGDTSDDFTANAVLSGGYNVGDTNQNGLLDLTEKWQFTYSGTAKAGEYVNVATVSGVATDYSKNTATITGTEDDCYYGATPSIAIVKTTNGTDDLCPILSVGDSVTWTYSVTNTGDIALNNIKVSDDNGTPGDLTDDFFANYVSGDVNGNGYLDLTETWLFSASGTVEDGHYDNIATVSGDATDDLQNVVTVTASEDDCYIGVTGPGVRTPGFWSNPLNGGQFWNGTPNDEKHRGEACFPIGELTYQVDKNGDGIKDNTKGLLIGDWDRNGIENNGEDTLFISLEAATLLINASQKEQQDGRYVVGRDLVATWLNYLAGNPVGDFVVDSYYSPKEAMRDAINFLQIYGDTADNGIVTNSSGKAIMWEGSAVKQGTSAWGDVGSPIHNALDEYNNFGTVNGTGYAHDCDSNQFLSSMRGGFSTGADLYMY